MSTILKIILLSIATTLIRCSSPINCIEHFTTYKEPIINGSKKILLKTDGIYISENGGACFFLYNNGKVKIYRPFFDTISASRWRSPQNILLEMNEDWEFKRIENWGDYVIKENEITLQNFNRNNQEGCKRSVFEEKGRILNDTTIEILSEHSFWWKNKSSVLYSPCILKFYKTDAKPDSTIAWFAKKNWYIKELSEDRR